MPVEQRKADSQRPSFEGRSVFLVILYYRFLTFDFELFEGLFFILFFSLCDVLISLLEKESATENIWAHPY